MWILWTLQLYGTAADSRLPPDFHCTIQVSEEEQLGLKIPKDTVISVQEIDKLTPSSGDRMLLPNEVRVSRLGLVTNEVKNNHLNILII